MQQEGAGPFPFWLRGLPFARECVTRLWRFRVDDPWRVVPSFHLADNRPPARGARFTFVPHQQVLDDAVEARVLFAAQPDIFLKRNVLRPADSPRLGNGRARFADASIEFFAGM
jgi:hypothetical protein